MKDTSRTYWLIGIVVVWVSLVTACGGGAVAWGAQKRPSAQKRPAARKPVASPASAPKSSIPTKADAYTNRRFWADMLDYNRRTMVVPYQQVGVRDPAWDEAAVKYLEANARAFSSQPDAPKPEQLQADGKSLLDKGCTDPMVLYCYGVALEDVGDPTQAQTALQRAVAGFQDHAYPRLRTFYASKHLMDLCLSDGKVDDADRWFLQTAAWLQDACGEVKDQGRDLQCFLTAIAGSWGSLYAYSPDDLRKALTANPKTPLYIANVTQAWIETDLAMKARGNTWPTEVGSAQWEKFDSHLRTAEKLLTQAWKQHPEFPQAPYAMIQVARGLSRADLEEQRVWFNRAVTAQMDYRPAYEEFLWSHRPRWGGSYDEMEQFGRACLQTGRFDTCVPWVYMEAVLAVRSESNHARDFDRPGVYEAMVRTCEGYLKAAETEEERNCYRTELAGFSWYTHHYPEARAAFEAAGAHAQASAIAAWGLGAGMAEVRAQTYALTGPAADLVARADALGLAGPVAKVRSLYQTALGRDKNPYAAAYLQYRLAELDARERYARGEWVDLISSPDLLGWEPTAGRWEREPDGALLGTSDARGLYLVNRGSYDSQLEVEGEIEYVQVPCRNAGRASLLLNYAPDPSLFRRGWDGIRLLISPPDSQVSLVRQSTDTPVSRVPVTMAQKVKFRLRARDGAATVYINDKLVQDAVRVLPEGHSEEGGLGLGSDYQDRGVVYRFRNLRVRKL